MPTNKAAIKTRIKATDLFAVTRERPIPFTLRGMALKELEDGVRAGVFRKMPENADVKYKV